MKPVQTFPTVADARRAILAAAAPGSTWRSTGAWSLAQVFTHAAQSVEFSLKGFPQPKPALFQQTLGRAAFSWFDSRGAMSHGLAEAIPGAEPLPANLALDQAAARLLASMDAFESHSGPLAPHFAYGALDKAAYTRAHLMHLANHWTEVVQG